ncbi:hypothetical protein BDQ17DRAFT_1370812 [Cyathus striatus]|nr:hypothetical protein BDQ17DRAFT_1370812 [Cyathus striatus]
MKWSLSKLLYIIARYCGLFYLSYAEVSHHRRVILFFFYSGSHLPNGSVDLIFILRVCALYGNSKRIIFCLTALLIGMEKY